MSRRSSSRAAAAPSTESITRAAGAIYLVTDAEASEFTLMRAALEAPARTGWSAVDCPAIAPARADTRLLRCDVLADHLVLTVRRDGAPLLVICDHDGGHIREIAPSLTAGTIKVEHAEEYDAGSVIVAEESLIEPPASYRLDLATGARKLLKRMEVPGYDTARYRTERLTAPAADGTPIPVTLAWRESTPLDGSAPCLLYGYGAYEATIEPEFDRSLPSLLDRGVVYAIAHIRGGGERGRQWWQQGRLQQKPTTFTDYLAVADGSPAATGRQSSTALQSSREGRPQAACSRAPSSRCGRTDGGRWSPRSHSSTS